MKKILLISFLLFTAILLIISCRSAFFPGTGQNAVTKGTGGGQTVGINYVLPEGSLSQDEQKREYNPNKNSITLFNKGDFGAKFYRIPALAVTKKGTILAAIDRRYNKTADLGKSSKIDLIVRRSTDLGTTWSEPIVIGPGAKQDSGADSYGDAFFINGHDGSVICGFITEPGIQAKNPRGKTVIYKSTDDGLTWTKISTFNPSDVPGADRGFGASGQGLTLRHGINKGKNKLMFGYFKWNTSAGGGGLSVAAMVSDDNGVTWRYEGEAKPSDNNIDETKAIELSDGRIMLNHRKGVGVGQRGWSISSDGGKTWVYQGIDPEVDDPGNNADFYRYEFDGKQVKTDKYILMINANAKKSGTWFKARKNHYVRLTKNEFANGNGIANGKYEYAKQLVIGGENLYSGYPTITVLPDGTIATLTEEVSPAETKEQDDYNIVFRRFNLFWLSDGKEYVNYSSDYLFTH